MAPSPHAQVALLSCSGIISLIWFRRAERVGHLENTFLVLSRFFVFLFFVLVLLLCRCSVSVYPSAHHLQSASIGLGISGNACERPSVSPPSWPFSSRWVESLASSSPVWEGEPLTRPWGAAGSQQVEFSSVGSAPFLCPFFVPHIPGRVFQKGSFWVRSSSMWGTGLTVWRDNPRIWGWSSQVFQTFSALVILCSVMTFIAGKAWCESRGFWGLELLFSLGEIWTSWFHT